MCSVCMHSPCLSGCPNDVGDPVYECEWCGGDIVEGEEYYEFDDCYYHEDCFKDNAFDILLDSGAEKGTAGDY